MHRVAWSMMLLALVVAACSGSAEATSTTGTLDVASSTTVGPPPPTTVGPPTTTTTIDGESLGYLASSECSPDPQEPQFVRAPFDTIVIRDLASSTAPGTGA